MELLPSIFFSALYRSDSPIRNSSQTNHLPVFPAVQVKRAAAPLILSS